MKDYQNKKILITGGLGFIGSNLAIKLVDFGAFVTCVDSLIPEYGGNIFNISPVKGKISINISDVRDKYSIEYLVKSNDMMFNLAGQTSHLDSMKNPINDLDINCRAQLIILEACKKYNNNIKIVFASTRQIYGKPQYLPVDEVHPINPVDSNGINKVAGESYHLLYNNIYGIKACALRLTNTYGPRMRIKDTRQTFLGIWIRNLIENKDIQIYGDGKQLRDLNYIDDVINALLIIGKSESAWGNVYNLGSKDVVELNTIAKVLIDLNKSGNINKIEFPDEIKSIDIGNYFSNFKKINKEFNWEPNISLKKGLSMTLDYYKEYFSYYI